MADVERRSFLAGMGAVAATARLPVRARGTGSAAPFSWGVASFDPTATGVLLWTRVDAAARLGWVVARNEDLTDIVASGDVEATDAADRCVRVVVTDLEPETTWWYGFTAPGGVRSPVGRTRTMPARPTERLRVAVVSCSRFASAGFAVYRALADREVDLVVHVGDYVYEDGSAGQRVHEPAERLVALDQYRQRYAQHRADPDLQALHARHPMVAVWDDHEVAGNAWRDGAPGHDEAVDGPWLARLLAAGQAHAEWVPGRTATGADGRLQAWRSVPLGGLAELVVLDTRTWGRERQPAVAEEVAEPRSLLGDDQQTFVASRLGADRAPWVLLANQVMLHPLAVPVPTDALAQQVREQGFLVVDGEALNPDQWDGYPQARQALLDAIGPAGGVVALTGDVHSSWAWEGPAEADAGPSMVELVAPSVSSEAFATRLPLPAAAAEAALQGLSPALSYVEVSSHGYLLVDLTAERAQGEWWFVDPADPSTQRFAAARAATRAVPMHLTEVLDPTTDPEPPRPPRTTARPVAAQDDDDDLPVLPAAAGALAAVTAALVALRRRRSP